MMSSSDPSTGVPDMTFSADMKASLEKKGCLEANILSVYDLPYPDSIPKAVTLSACGMTVQSGPPLARQKDRNSFRFAPINESNGNGSNNQAPIKLVAPLRELYQSTLKVRVVYDDQEKCLETDLDLKELLVNEQKWLILTLSSSESGVSGNNTTTNATTTAVTIGNVAEEDMSPPPTIRINFKLSGPLRPEFAALMNFAKAWFGIVDSVEGKFSKTTSALGQNMPGSVNKNLLLVPAVPILAIIVAAFPLVAGVAAIALPFLLPVALICVGILAAVLLSGGVLYSSTKSGRHRVKGALNPLVETLVISRPGQALVYDIGPRPTPVTVCRQVLPATIWSKLWISLVIDLIGSSSYLLPVVGEGFDLAWAPAQTILIMAMYDATSPNLKYVSFMEEVLPFTDVIPSASIGWACEFLPSMWKHHAQKNNIRVDPEVTQAVSQLMSTAVKVVRTRNQTTPTSTVDETN